MFKNDEFIFKNKIYCKKCGRNCLEYFLVSIIRFNYKKKFVYKKLYIDSLIKSI